MFLVNITKAYLGGGVVSKKKKMFLVNITKAYLGGGVVSEKQRDVFSQHYQGVLGRRRGE
jgi:hypothetical protein